MKLFVSGRLCLFGEHSDWAGQYSRMNADIVPGLAIVSGIEQGIYAEVERSHDIRIRTVDESGAYGDWVVWPLSAARLRATAKEGGFYSYFAGVAAYMLEHYDVGGVSVDVYEVTIPIKKGLSSSAAICCLVARAFNMLYNLQISVCQEMEAAYRGEIMTPSRCGRLDQACAYGKRPVLMRFDGEDVEVKRLAVKKDLYWVYANLGGDKDTCEILSALNACYPFAQSEKARRVQRALGQENVRIVERVVEALKQGNPAAIGALMDRAQQIFDTMVAPACPKELLAPRLHAVMNDARVRALALGVKGVGSQGDGAVQMICESEEKQRALRLYLEESGMQAYCLTVRAQHSVRKAIIPVAGFGARMFPASKVLKKELFPVMDTDGRVKPMLLILLEELLRSGIEEIGLIINPQDQRDFDKLFGSKRDEAIHKLSKEMRELNVHIQQIGKKITYIYQTEPLGFGHAVYLARGFSAGEPVLLLLGDHIYKTHTAKTCAQQLLEVYEQSGMLTVSLDEVSLENVSHYGVIKGNFINEEERIMQATAIVEKPTCTYAKSRLAVPNKRGEEKFYCIFGQYVLTPAVFALLEKRIASRKPADGEIQLTDALAELCATDGMIACRIDGERFDVGIPRAYRDTMYLYGRKRTVG